MIIIWESIGLCALFTLGVCGTIKDPIKDINNYPPKIIERTLELGMITEDMLPRSKKVMAKKLFAAVAFAFILALALHYVNGAMTFASGFGTSYLLWTIVNVYDAIVLDCIWFCHSKKVILPGTEDMVDEYKNYWFHISGSLKGMLVGLPVCALAGAIATVLF